MLHRKNVIKGLVALSMAGVLFYPANAYADRGNRGSWGKHDDRHSDRRNNDHRDQRQYDVRRGYPGYGKVVFESPSTFISLSVGGINFFYREGVFYRPHGLGYVVVAPPRGVAIRSLPWGCQRVIVNRTTYFTHQGIYYQYTPYGYVVVPPPTVTVVQLPAPSVQAVATHPGIGGR